MENKLDTLVILSPGFPANEADTTCMPPMQLFVKTLKEICPGLNIIVLSFQYPHITGSYDWFGVTVIAIGGRSKGRLFRAATWINAWRILKKLNRKYRLMGLLSFWFGECAFVGSYFAKLYHLSHFSWILGQDAKKGNKYFNWIKPKGDSLIALSDFIAREFRKNYKITPLHIIPVGIDTSLFGPPPAKRDIDILGAGSLIPLKRYDLFIGSIGVLKESFPDIKAVICGKGPEMAGLQTLAGRLNLSGNIAFAGELPYAEVLAMMQRSKIFLHTSNYEGFGAVLAEALYAGAHVVSFCKPMDREYRHHYVVNSAEEMNAGILNILKKTGRGHDPVLMCEIQQVAKNVISLFADQ